MPTLQATEELLITTVLTSWNQWIGRTSRTFDAITDEQMLIELAPGKNRPVYLLGHLLVVNDAMVPQLRLGEASHEVLRETFVVQPDNPAVPIPPVAELRQNWKDVNTRLDSLFAKLTPAEWLERHSSVSEEDFAKEPHRNRLAILLSRTSHSSYHLGQLMLRAK